MHVYLNVFSKTCFCIRKAGSIILRTQEFPWIRWINVFKPAVLENSYHTHSGSSKIECSFANFHEQYQNNVCLAKGTATERNTCYLDCCWSSVLPRSSYLDCLWASLAASGLLMWRYSQHMDASTEELIQTGKISLPPLRQCLNIVKEWSPVRRFMSACEKTPKNHDTSCPCGCTHVTPLYPQSIIVWCPE